MMLAPPCFMVFRVYCGLNSVFGGRLTNCLRPLDPKRTILLLSVHKMFLHFSLGLSACSLANCIFFSTSWFRTNKINVMEWPAQSLNLDPIENLWGDIKHAVSEAKPRNAQKLWKVVKSSWAEITVYRCQ